MPPEVVEEETPPPVEDQCALCHRDASGSPYLKFDSSTKTFIRICAGCQRKL